MIYASIITIGDELLIGQTIDTNSAFIAQELNKRGIWVRSRVAVGDDAAEIKRSLDQESQFSKLVIITGGLGPTDDDITKSLLNEYFNGKMVVNEAVREHIIYLFEKIYRRPGPILERNLKQAEVPDTATVLHNERGSAPGMWFEKNDVVFVSLPGVPYEMKGLMLNEVLPKIEKHFTLPTILHRTAYTFGMGESMIAERLIDFEKNLPDSIKLAYLPGYGLVKLRLSAQGDKQEDLKPIFEKHFQSLLEYVKDVLVSDADEEMEAVLGHMLKARGKTVSTAESCTGGYIAHLLTKVSGSSSYFKGSIVSYTNEVKENLLGVPAFILETYGAVSEETAQYMVKGALEKLQTDYAIAATGLMGPASDGESKPVGTVWLAVGDKDNISTIQLNLRFERTVNIHYTGLQALNLLRKFLNTNS